MPRLSKNTITESNNSGGAPCLIPLPFTHGRGKGEGSRGRRAALCDRKCLSPSDFLHSTAVRKPSPYPLPYTKRERAPTEAPRLALRAANSFSAISDQGE